MNVSGERIVDRERRYESEGIRLSYLSSRVLGAATGIEPGANLEALLARPHGAYSLRTLVKHGLLDDVARPTPLGERFASRVYRELLLVPPTQALSINFGDERLPKRFWDKAIPEPMTGCWLWLGSCHELGYGTFVVNGADRPAHQVSYIVLRAAIPDGLEIDHKCHTPACMNPWHLEPVTHGENIRRWWQTKTRDVCSKGHTLIGPNRGINRHNRPYCKLCYRVTNTDGARRRRAARRTQ